MIHKCYGRKVVVLFFECFVFVFKQIFKINGFILLLNFLLFAFKMFKKIEMYFIFTSRIFQNEPTLSVALGRVWRYVHEGPSSIPEGGGGEAVMLLTVGYSIQGLDYTLSCKVWV